MKKDKLSLFVLAIEIAAIILLHSAKSRLVPDQQQLAGKKSPKSTELRVTSEAMLKTLK